VIASRLGVWITGVIALVLVVVAAIDLARETSPPSRALVSAFDAAQVTKLEWKRGKDEPAIEIVRADKGWKWTRPVAGVPAEPSAIDGVFAALRGARWHRRASIERGGELHASLTVTLKNRTLRIGVGAMLAGAGQTWLAIGEHAYLVDDWVVNALMPEPLALRDSHPFRDAAFANTIVIERLLPQHTSVRIEGHPRRLVRPIELLLYTERADAIERALSAVKVIGVPINPTMTAPVVGSTLSIDGPPLVSLDVFEKVGDDPCTKGRRVGGTIGPACVEGIDHLWEELDVLHRVTRDLVEPRLVPFAPTRITFPDGGVLDLAKRPQIGGDDADIAKVAELVALLQTPLEPVDDATTASPVGTLVVADRAGTTITVELLASKKVRRKGEPIAFPVGAGAWDILVRPSSAYRDRLLWREDPVTIEWITVNEDTYRRHGVIGEWSDPTRSKQLEALARALATPRAEPLAAPRKTHDQVKFTVIPPVGQLVERTLRIGDNCYATVEDKPVILEKPLCDAIGAMLQR
jgi:hypothetical protein